MSYQRRTMLVHRALPALALWASVLLSCGTGGAPEVAAVRPAKVAPGGMVMLTGRGFSRADTVWIAGRELANVSWVNAGLLATTLPADLPTGSHTLEVRSASGRRTALAVEVAALHSSAPHDAAPPQQESSPTPAPTTQPTPSPPPATQPPQVPATPAPRPPNPPRDDDKDKKDEDKGRGKGNQGGGNGGHGGGRGR